MFADICRPLSLPFGMRTQCLCQLKARWVMDDTDPVSLTQAKIFPGYLADLSKWYLVHARNLSLSENKIGRGKSCNHWVSKFIRNLPSTDIHWVFTLEKWFFTKEEKSIMKWSSNVKWYTFLFFITLKIVTSNNYSFAFVKSTYSYFLYSDCTSIMKICPPPRWCIMMSTMVCWRLRC